MARWSSGVRRTVLAASRGPQTPRPGGLRLSGRATLLAAGLMLPGVWTFFPLLLLTELAGAGQASITVLSAAGIVGVICGVASVGVHAYWHPLLRRVPGSPLWADAERRVPGGGAFAVAIGVVFAALSLGGAVAVMEFGRHGWAALVGVALFVAAALVQLVLTATRK